MWILGRSKLFDRRVAALILMALGLTHPVLAADEPVRTLSYYGDLARLVGQYQLVAGSADCDRTLSVTPTFGRGDSLLVSGVPTSLWIRGANGYETAARTASKSAVLHKILGLSEFGTGDPSIPLGWSDWVERGLSFEVSSGYFKTADGHITYAEARKQDGKTVGTIQVSIKRTGSQLHFFEAFRGPEFGNHARNCLYGVESNDGIPAGSAVASTQAPTAAAAR